MESTKDIYSDLQKCQLDLKNEEMEMKRIEDVIAGFVASLKEEKVLCQTLKSELDSITLDISNQTTRFHMVTNRKEGLLRSLSQVEDNIAEEKLKLEANREKGAAREFLMQKECQKVDERAQNIQNYFSTKDSYKKTADLEDKLSKEENNLAMLRIDSQNALLEIQRLEKELAVLNAQNCALTVDLARTISQRNKLERKLKPTVFRHPSSSSSRFNIRAKPFIPMSPNGDESTGSFLSRLKRQLQSNETSKDMNNSMIPKNRKRLLPTQLFQQQSPQTRERRSMFLSQQTLSLSKEQPVHHNRAPQVHLSAVGQISYVAKTNQAQKPPSEDQSSNCQPFPTQSVQKPPREDQTSKSQSFPTQPAQKPLTEDQASKSQPLPTQPVQKRFMEDQSSKSQPFPTKSMQKPPREDQSSKSQPFSTKPIQTSLCGIKEQYYAVSSKQQLHPTAVDDRRSSLASPKQTQAPVMPIQQQVRGTLNEEQQPTFLSKPSKGILALGSQLASKEIAKSRKEVQKEPSLTSISNNQAAFAGKEPSQQSADNNSVDIFSSSASSNNSFFGEGFSFFSGTNSGSADLDDIFGSSSGTGFLF